MPSRWWEYGRQGDDGRFLKFDDVGNPRPQLYAFDWRPRWLRCCADPQKCGGVGCPTVLCCCPIAHRTSACRCAVDNPNSRQAVNLRCGYSPTHLKPAPSPPSPPSPPPTPLGRRDSTHHVGREGLNTMPLDSTKSELLKRFESDKKFQKSIIAKSRKLLPTVMSKFGANASFRRFLDAQACDVLEDYAKFFTLKVVCGDVSSKELSPTPMVDKIWHAHILYNMAEYFTDCAYILKLVMNRRWISQPNGSYILKLMINHRRIEDKAELLRMSKARLTMHSLVWPADIGLPMSVESKKRGRSEESKNRSAKKRIETRGSKNKTAEVKKKNKTAEVKKIQKRKRGASSEDSSWGNCG